jgi:hypothetical protein
MVVRNSIGSIPVAFIFHLALASERKRPFTDRKRHIIYPGAEK